ncbi:hypothetical protein N7535_004396 [Penicillium sp. DV-2018c]|nr:hypothetical protein N7461_007981 [Penicillium sp. DV-2018c]KAJ5570736.1 hypothetical protein N7535_004396 [Penicillium sp. DV-2018c]
MASKTPAAFQVQQTRKRLDQFSVDLEAAINHATKFSPYRKTAVVAFHWDNDDIGVEPLEGELLGVFRFVFGFEIESFSIPVEDSQRMLLEYLVSWSRRHSADNTLRIFVYSGHAICPRTFASRWYLGGQFNPHTGGLKGPSVDWWAVQGYLEELKGDACYIFDCCYPQSGVLGAYDGPEFMAASVWDQAVTPSTNLSFTRILIDELRQLNGQSETLASIYSRVFSCAQLNQSLKAAAGHKE